MSEAARPPAAGERQQPRMVEVGRSEKNEVRRFPVLPQNSAVLRVAWWTAKCRAVATGNHVYVLEGIPESDASAIDGEAGGDVGFDGPRALVNSAGLQEATLEVQAKRMLRQIEEWAEGLLDGGAK